MVPEALIVWGGWEGHEPSRVAEFMADLLTNEGFAVRVEDSLEAFARLDAVVPDLVVPIYTMGRIEHHQRDPVLRAVSERGVGLAGCHGGMCDAFRDDTEWQFLTGGQWVAHPGGDRVRYWVRIRRDVDHPITAGIPDFEVESEQYYLHVDPGNEVLAYTEFPTPGVGGPHVGNPCRMPQVWTKSYGQGRVFYFALGHRRSDLEAPEPREVMRRGLLWAAKRL